MKLRPLLVLLLFVVSAGVLVWIYYAVTHSGDESRNAVWDETIADLRLCSTRKHVKSTQYDHFAAIASEEQHAAAARLFRAMALSERIHEHNCANAIVRFGGHYQPPTKVVVFHGTTDDNLARSIAYERQTLQERNGKDVARAMAKGNRYAARILTWAAGGDLRHVVLMEERRRVDAPSSILTASFHAVPMPSAAPADSTASYLVCPTCGNIWKAGEDDAYCPFCLTEGAKFIRFE